jgi:ATP-binding cassette subfamily B (MDR/TAP) protein 1
MNKVPYASTIDTIMYVMICTRPDLPYALGVTSRYQSDPGKEHWTSVKIIHKYLRRTNKDIFLVYGGDE